MQRECRKLEPAGNSSTLSNFADWYERGPVPRFSMSKPEGNSGGRPSNGQLGVGFHHTHNGGPLDHISRWVL